MKYSNLPCVGFGFCSCTLYVAMSTICDPGRLLKLAEGTLAKGFRTGLTPKDSRRGFVLSKDLGRRGTDNCRAEKPKPSIQ